MDRFHVLVGPNASGKTTFFNVIDFLGKLLDSGLQDAIRSITPSPRDLLFNHEGDKFELAIEAKLPGFLLEKHDYSYDRIRYEICIAIDRETEVPSIDSEYVRFLEGETSELDHRSLFPEIVVPPETIIKYRSSKSKAIASKNKTTGKDNFYPEFKKGRGGGWVPSFQLGQQKSAFANLPEDEDRFPAATWFKGFLVEGVQNFVLDSIEMRQASAPGQVQSFSPSGKNLPWVVEELRLKHYERYEEWISHIQTALEDLVEIKTIERSDTRHRYIVVKYASGIEVPSWMVSDGTLRLLALTLPAYLPDFSGVLLIEEPENGIHPKAIETMFQALSNVYNAQVLLATHSPVVLSAVDVKDVMCFAKNSIGATDIIMGQNHPALRDWQRNTSLGSLFAAGVLG